MHALPMPKCFARIVAILLVPCLVGDPTVMASIGPSIQSIQISGRHGSLPLQFPFTSQALAAAELSGSGPLKPEKPSAGVNFLAARTAGYPSAAPTADSQERTVTTRILVGRDFSQRESEPIFDSLRRLGIRASRVTSIAAIRNGEEIARISDFLPGMNPSLHTGDFLEVTYVPASINRSPTTRLARIPIPDDNSLQLHHLIGRAPLYLGLSDIQQIDVFDRNGNPVKDPDCSYTAYRAPTWDRAQFSSHISWGHNTTPVYQGGWIDVIYYPREGMGPSPFDVPVSPPHPNLAVAISVMNAGAEQRGGQIVPRDSLHKIDERVDKLAELGAGRVYITGLEGPSYGSGPIHDTPGSTDAERFVPDGPAYIRVTGYPTGEAEVGGIRLGDRRGSIFPMTGTRSIQH